MRPAFNQHEAKISGIRVHVVETEKGIICLQFNGSKFLVNIKWMYIVSVSFYSTSAALEYMAGMAPI